MTFEEVTEVDIIYRKTFHKIDKGQWALVGYANEQFAAVIKLGMSPRGWDEKEQQNMFCNLPGVKECNLVLHRDSIVVKTHSKEWALSLVPVIQDYINGTLR